MNIITNILITAGMVSLFAACAQKDSQDPKPVKQAVTKKTASSTPTKQPNQTKAISQAQPNSRNNTGTIQTTAFRTPADDINLPTDAEMAEGRESSTGNGRKPADKPSSAPSISVTPPTTSGKPQKKEAQLDP